MSFIEPGSDLPPVLKKFEIQALPTKYDGCDFRSRIEARWAVFFNTLGLRYEYEREGFDLGVRAMNRICGASVPVADGSAFSSTAAPIGCRARWIT